ncbi:winged helix-turn-helix transcriptional regulator [Natrarchaeobius halalkaliphilus]|uniref:Winged helix-turn-helix transcriptional regulator n=1 Tax=Natrarchaeobius halalkaliphilus TaxID=1679091 RepID=A0A3N6LHU2_9EURY|nr:winged helix-turn-helix transcriptional regulator [Natrarchaeobius halalkaliphilus]RQG86195.1 winged helix-turn-helix transcriptional regulator [Natrarchaeobius halalkaliphilus]
MDIDKTDRKILYLLEKETETNLTHDKIAERIDVSSSTVTNRIQELKNEGILEGFQPKVNYEQAGIPYHVLFVCTVPVEKRRSLAEEALAVDGVVETRELLTGRRNLHVEVVSIDISTVESCSEELESKGIDIDQSDILRRKSTQPFNHIIQEMVDKSNIE